ncbi:prepilin-type N-terminal cleavage/methylation domain-containing protein [Opitutaceae bacterium TAV4]|nr:prepilin-type N-terminal cleavage/methylation domain-containing protein [Opitutaceae bacterium TAV3]RRK01382.1 prepilin-type N-terminal cleavage/methylation domain-containing protein [Opitutaceae bacterium TAV4]
MHSRNASAFTLIELLTVIAIIGILAAIIIPVTGKVRKSAQATKCASNLRQIQLANIHYATDNKGRYVAQSKKENGTTTNWHSVTEFIACLDVKRRPGFLLAESWPKEVLCPMATIDGGVINRAYGYNGTGLPSASGDEYLRQVTVSQVPNPSRTLAFADAVDWNINESGADKYTGETYVVNATAYRHDQRACVAFWDGHIERLSRERLTTDPVIWKTLE